MLENTVITSIKKTDDGFVMTGCLKQENYRLLVVKMDEKGKLVWKKIIGYGKRDYEGQNLIEVKDGYLVCGGGEGKATDSGGTGWKVYLLKLDSHGSLVWENSYRLNGNECGYSILEDGNIFLLGDSNIGEDNRGLFLMKIDPVGKLLWHRSYGAGRGSMASGMIKSEGGYVLVGSLRDDDVWRTNIFKVDENGDVLWEKTHSKYCILNMIKVNGDYILTGSKEDRICLLRLDPNGQAVWERTFDKGTGISVIDKVHTVLLAGEIIKDGDVCPILYEVDMHGNLNWERVYEKGGYFEAIEHTKTGFVLARQSHEPSHTTEIIFIDESGAII